MHPGCRMRWVAAATGVVLGLTTNLPTAASASPVSSPTTRAVSLTALLAGPRIRVGDVPFVPPGAQPLGTLPPTTTFQVDVTLRPPDPAGLAGFVADVSDPGSPLFHHYLPPGAFADRFGPTPATVSTVEGVLGAEGLRVVSVAADRLSIAVTGKAKAMERAFGVTLDRYRLPSGRLARAPGAAPTLPGSVAAAVQGVIGLSDTAELQPQDLRSPPAPTVPPSAAPPASRSLFPHVAGPAPCTAAVNDGTSFGAFTANRLASAYGLTSFYGAGNLGAGATVALYELEPDSPTDIATYQACYGTSTAISTVTVDGGSGSGAGSGEAALDIEGVLSLAPAASLSVYQGPNSGSGPYDVYRAMANAATPPEVISTSWGLCEAQTGLSSARSEQTLFQQMAAQGETVLAAAGDNGSTDCTSGGNPTSALAVDDPSSQPYVTGVGGTHLTLDGSNQRATETVWNQSANSDGAGGGGISKLWTMPTFQSSAPAALGVVNARSSGTPCGASSGRDCRQVPDLTADADPFTGYVVYYSGGWTAFGGTSAAAPLVAALVALADSSTMCSPAGPIGWLNPDLYAAAGSSTANYAASFADVTSGTNDYTPSGYAGGLFPAGTAYDMASGLGAPNAAALAPLLCGPTLSQVSPPTGPAAGGTTVTVTGTRFSKSPGATTVDFGTTPGTGVVCASTTSCTVTAPSGFGAVPVTVVVGGDTSPVPTTFTFVPSVTSVTPNSGVPSGGTAVTVNGTGFDTAGGTTLAFGGVAATGVSCSSALQCTATSPAGTGTVDVRATVAGQTSPTGAADQFTYLQSPQTITVTSSAPAGSQVGMGSYTPTATATSGLTVAVTSASGPVCTVSAGVVSFAGAGACTLDFNQAGNANYLAAPQQTQGFTVGAGPQTISVTSSAPVGAQVGVGSYTPTASASSGLAVAVTSATGPVCTVSGGVVSFVGAGTCTLDFNQAGNANYTAAAQQTQTFTVSLQAQTISVTSSAPAPVGAQVGVGSYIPTASASSGLVVAVTSATGPVCTVSAGVVSFVGAGTCTLDFNQAGNATYAAAAQQTQSFAVSLQAQTISVSSSAPVGAQVGVGSYSPTATASSGLTVAVTSATGPACTVSAGVVSFVGSGTCTLDFNQAGNATYAAAPQQTQTFTVGAGPQTISVSSSAPVGAQVGVGSYSPTATASSGLTVAVTSATGPVCTVSAGVVSFVGAGSCTLDYNQAGNASYLAAGQQVQSFTVALRPQTLSVSSSAPVGAQVGVGSYTPSATATSGLTVAVTSATTAVCTVLAGVVSFGAAGSCTLDFDQAGNATFAAAARQTQTFTVSAGPQTITVTSSAPVGAQVGVGGYSPTATASSGLVVTVTTSTTAVCTISAGVVSFAGAGTCTLHFDQAGNANDTAATEQSQSFAVSLRPQVVTVTSTAPAGAQVGVGTYTPSATASSGLAVVVTSAAPAVCTVSAGVVSFAGAGTCTLDFDQGGDTTYAAASRQTQGFPVGAGPQAITVTSTAPAGAAVGLGSYTPTASASSGLVVTVTSATAAVCTISAGVVSFVGAGTCVLDFDQAGDADYSPAVEQTESFTVSSLAQRITVTSSASSTAQVGVGTYTPTATASSGLTVSVASATPGVCTVSGGTVSFVAAGTCLLHFDQAGNATYAAAPQQAQSFTVGAGPQTVTVTSTAPTGPVVGAGSYAPTASASSGLAVAVTSATTAICTMAGGMVSFVAAGNCTLDFNQAGTTNYTAAPQVQQTVVVGRAATTTTVVSVHDPSIAGQPVTLTASIAVLLPGSAARTTLTGTVRFTVGSIVLCAAAPVAGGQASCAGVVASAATLNVTAVYSGDANFSASGATGSDQIVQTGYWEVASDGGIFAFGAPFYGSMGGQHLNRPVVSMTVTPDARGYWEVAADGGIFAFGDAGFFGSMGGVTLNKPVVGMVATADGRGYWLVAADGGVFAFGDAGFYGSAGSLKLNKPVVGMVATSDGRGYCMVASDGGVFAFGDATFAGNSLGIGSPIVALAATPDNRGYWLVAQNGNVAPFGTAANLGSMLGQPLSAPLTGAVATADGGGYWLVATDGGIFAFGDARFAGSMGGKTLVSPIVGIARL